MTDAYDVVIVGGAIYGSAVAWFLASDPDFDGRILVVERDPTYQFAATSHTNSCIRQQFSSPLNIRISQFGAAYIKDFRAQMGLGDEVPHLALQSFGYLYLADTPAFAASLKEAQALQSGLGAGTRHMTPDQIVEAFPFLDLTGILAGNHNPVDEGYFDGGTLFDWWKRGAKRLGVTYVTDEVIDLTCTKGRVTHAVLRDAGPVSCGWLVNAAGTRGRDITAMAGIELPIEPRKRYSYVFQAAEPLDRYLPLTIDPSGVHVRSEGRFYLAGSKPEDDSPVAVDDFDFDHSLWESTVWPAIATRIPAFERVKVINAWVGHYDYNTLDQNAIVGPHPEVANLMLLNGFSGHGLQQSPALGRGVAERLIHGAYRTLDLSPLGFQRIIDRTPLTERAVI